MKELEKEFNGTGEVKGFKFKQLFSNGFAFMYELTDAETGNIWYEVFIRTISPAGEATINGSKIVYEERERYPKTSNFGEWAWCIIDLDDAFKKYNEISAVVLESKLKQHGKDSTPTT